ncbi:MAG: aldo/keto reductase [Verrucomicrobiota bacterium]|jgi:predicted aldo/keto reductase-like oxidoreductase
MKSRRFNRRQFLQTSATVTGALLVSPGALTPGWAAPAKRTAVDQMTLGSTGIKLSRLGMGTGTDSGRLQRDLGREGFNSLVKYAYDQGITYFDCAQAYTTFDWLGGAIKGLPREKLFIQSKIGGQPKDVLGAIDHHRKVFDTDFVDSMLIHCMVKNDWTDQWKRIMDGFNEAKAKGWIRSKGVSCHSLPALRGATATPWVEVHLVRVNPQGRHTDNEEESMWSAEGDGNNIAPVLKQIKAMRAKGRGIIGMKIIGNGEFVEAADREKSIRFAMSLPELDAIVIGFKSRAEIDEAIQRMNRALAEA